MREIKFRGKTRMSGEWVYGFYVERDGVDCGMIYDSTGLGTDVDKKTVGQFVNSLDKNKVDIYEGDIVHYKQEIFGANIDEIEVVENMTRWLRKVGYEEREMGQDYYEHSEVIGNIYENSELLK